jgi:serine/threonine protein kinase
MKQIPEASLESLVGRLADEFMQRLQRGEQPDIDDYTRRFPGQETAVRQILTALLALHSAVAIQAVDSAQQATTISEGANQHKDASQPAEAILDDYELQEELGRGGMGVVYKARHKKLKRLVALKMILAGAHAGPQDLQRFRLEAEAIARLQHPNIVQIHEVGECPRTGKPYFALEYVEGGSLRAKLAGTPLPPLEAATLIATLARAMQAAHQHGVIHRDLKPANVLLTKDGAPKITDFGLAKQLGDDAGQTHSGQILGTPSYMAPEQATGNNQAVGPAADIYALGAMRPHPRTTLPRRKQT